MKFLKLFENFQENKISVTISKDTLSQAYWKVYYPYEDKNIRMDYDDFIESTLDAIHGDIKTLLGKNQINVKHTKDSHNTQIDVDNGTMIFVINSDKNKAINFIDDYCKQMLHEFFNNSFKSIQNLEYKIIDNHDINNKISKIRLQSRIDYALDNGDYVKVKELSKLL